jgi:hypothetical protein
MDWTDTSQWERKGGGPRMSEKVEMAKLGDKWQTFRLIGKPIIIASHWINIYNPDSKKKPKGFPKPCHGAYFADDGSMQIDASKCAYCTILENTPNVTAYSNAINRSKQENQPKRSGKPTRYEKKLRKLHGTVAFYKEDLNTDAWTPVEVIRITTSLGKKISEIASLNTRKTEEGKKAFGPEHPKFGFDLMLKYNEKAASPGEMYSAQKGENTKLEREEVELLRWNVPTEVTENPKDAEKEAKRVKAKVTDRTNVLLFPELAEQEKKKSKGDKHGKYRDQFDEDDEDEDDDEDDDDRKSSKKSSKKSSSKKTKKRSRDDDDDDEDSFDDDEDDDSDEDEDDEDEDEDEDDEEEDRKKRIRAKKKKLLAEKLAKKKKGKNGKKKRSRDDDDDEIPF